MEYVLSNGFCEMTEKEMEAVDGGIDIDIVDIVGKFASGGAGSVLGKKVGSTIGGAVGGPIGQVVGGIVGVAIFEVIYHLNN